jgi:hypothetical protein
VKVAVVVVLQRHSQSQWHRLQLSPLRFRHEFQPLYPTQHALVAKILGRILERRTDPREPPPDIFHRASHGSNDAASIRTRMFRNRVM